MKIKIDYTPRKIQLQMHRGVKRWNVVLCHRRAGKTCWAINHLIKEVICSHKPYPRYAYIAPLLKQAKDIAWDYLKRFSAPIPGIQTNEAELKIKYPNGGIIRLYGADNPDSMRGIYLDGCILDEYDQMTPIAFTEVIRPALSDRGGFAVFMGTPKGMRNLYRLIEENKDNKDWAIFNFKASETGILSAEELADARRLMGEDEYMQEYENSFLAALKGAYWADALENARLEKRITKVPYERHIPVDTWWDLGVSESNETAIWLTQDHGREIHVVDYYEAADEGLPHFRDILQEKMDKYKVHLGKHTGPHDLVVREWGSGARSRIEMARDLGINFIPVPKIEHKIDAIHAGTQMIGKCWFDEERCEKGLLALRSYRRIWDAEMQRFRSKPLHDWASNGADAWQTFARGHRFGNPNRRVLAERNRPRAAGWTS